MYVESMIRRAALKSVENSDGHSRAKLRSGEVDVSRPRSPLDEELGILMQVHQLSIAEESVAELLLEDLEATHN